MSFITWNVIKNVDYDINEGLFDLLDEELNCIRETNGR